MGRVFSKYVFLSACLLMSIEVVADGVDLPPPVGIGCCEKYQTDSPLEEDNVEYEKCLAMEAANPGSYCNPVIPIDNSIYIYALMTTGFVLASFVIVKKIKHKKTPM